MPNYQNAKIYKLVSNISNDIYIGSTVNKLTHRLNKHKDKNNKCVSKRLFSNDAVIKIILIELYPCSCKLELASREHHYITTLVCINKNIPFITDIVVVNGDKKEYAKEYREANKEHIKEYYEANKEHIKEHKKEYNEANKEHIKEYYKEYYEANKNKINEQRCERRAKLKNIQNIPIQ